MENKSNLPPPDLGRNGPETTDFLREMAVWTLPRDPRGEGDKNKIKSVLKYSWVTWVLDRLSAAHPPQPQAPMAGLWLEGANDLQEIKRKHPWNQIRLDS